MLKYIHEIFYLLGPDRRKLPVICILFTTASMLDLAGLGLIGPYVTLVVDPDAMDSTLGGIIDFIGLPRDQQQLIILLSLCLFVIFLLKTFSAIVINWMINRFSQKQQLRLRSFLMQAYQELPYTEYLNRNSAEYIDSINRLTGQFASVILSLLRNISDGIVGLVILTFLAWTNGLALSLLVGLLGTMVFSFDRIFRKRLRKYGQQVNQASRSMTQGIYEGIEGLKEIRVLGHEAYFQRKVRDSAREVAKYVVRQMTISNAPRYLLELIMVSFIVVLVFGLSLYGRDIKTLLPILGVFAVASLRLIPWANLLSVSLAQLRVSRNSISLLHQDLKHLNQLRFEHLVKAEITPSTRKQPEGFKVPFRSLELQNLGFRYPNAMSKALKEIFLEIRAGESVGLIGPSGAGKTTLVDVLLGLLEPQDGGIIYNGKSLHKNIPDWLVQVAYLPQQVFLIDNTLRHNVALGIEDKSIDEKLLCDALRKARLAELVEQLPQGVETLLGERGVRLSGGQRQRVALARAFYHGRKVLVMDEATSALDEKTELEIVEEIKHLKGKVTLIVIAHRLTTVKHCDRIYLIEDGRLVDSGTPKQMLNLKKVVNS